MPICSRADWEMITSMETLVTTNCTEMLVTTGSLVVLVMTSFMLAKVTMC